MTPFGGFQRRVLAEATGVLQGKRGEHREEAPQALGHWLCTGPTPQGTSAGGETRLFRRVVQGSLGKTHVWAPAGNSGEPFTSYENLH